VHELRIPENALHLWSYGVDVRVVPIAIGVAVVGTALIRQRNALQVASASSGHADATVQVVMERPGQGSAVA
jgi:hypothetical protein